MMSAVDRKNHSIFVAALMMIVIASLIITPLISATYTVKTVYAQESDNGEAAPRNSEEFASRFLENSEISSNETTQTSPIPIPDEETSPTPQIPPQPPTATDDLASPTPQIPPQPPSEGNETIPANATSEASEELTQAAENAGFIWDPELCEQLQSGIIPSQPPPFDQILCPYLVQSAPTASNGTINGTQAGTLNAEQRQVYERTFEAVIQPNTTDRSPIAPFGNLQQGEEGENVTAGLAEWLGYAGCVGTILVATWADEEKYGPNNPVEIDEFCREHYGIPKPGGN